MPLTHAHNHSPLPGQRQNRALPNRGGLHLSLRPRHPLAELQASLHLDRDARGWWHRMASASQVSPAHLNCKISLLSGNLGHAFNALFDFSDTVLLCMLKDELSFICRVFKSSLGIWYCKSCSWCSSCCNVTIHCQTSGRWLSSSFL